MDAPLNALRYLVVAAADRGAERVCVNVTPWHSISMIETFKGPEYMDGQTGHASLGPGALFSDQCQAAALTISNNVFLISSRRIGEEVARFTVSLWQKVESSSDARITAHVVFEAAITSLMTQWMIRPVFPPEPNFQAEFDKVFQSTHMSLLSTHMSLLRLVKETGMNARSLHLQGLCPSLRLLAYHGGHEIRMIPAGEPMTYTAQTRVGLSSTDLRTFLASIFIPDRGVQLGLQGLRLKAALPVYNTWNWSRTAEYGRTVFDLPAQQGTHCCLKLWLGYDQYDHVSASDDSAFGIHIYINGILVDLNFKVPSMTTRNNKRLLGVCFVHDARYLPQTLYWLHDREFQPLRYHLACFVEEFYSVERPDRKLIDTMQEGLHEWQKMQKKRQVRPRARRPPKPEAPKVQAAPKAAHNGSARRPGQLAATRQTDAVETLSEYKTKDQAAQKPMKLKKMFEAAVVQSVAAPTVPTVPTEVIPLTGWRKIMKDLLVICMDKEMTKGVFNQPVDIVALNIPDYHQIVKIPMDFGSVLALLEQGAYTHYTQVIEHMFLVLDNCRSYNPPDNEFHILAKDMERIFLNVLKGKLAALEKAAKLDPPPLTVPERFAKLHALNTSHIFGVPEWLTGIWPCVRVFQFPTHSHATIRPYSIEGVEATMQLIKNRIDSRKRDAPAPLMKVVKVATPPGAAPEAEQPLNQYRLSMYRHVEMNKHIQAAQSRNKTVIPTVISPPAQQPVAKSFPLSPRNMNDNSEDNGNDMMVSPRQANKPMTKAVLFSPIVINNGNENDNDIDMLTSPRDQHLQK